MTDMMIMQMIAEHSYKELKRNLETIHPVDFVDILNELEHKYIVLIFRLLAKEDAAETFAHMNSDMQEALIHSLNEAEIREVMDELYLDDVADILEELPANLVDKLLEATDEDTRHQINELLNYPEDSAGSIMNVEYIAFRKEMTVAESMLKIRQVGINKETIYICYVTEKRKLIGCVMLMDLLSSRDDETIENIMESNVIYVRTDDNQEDVNYPLPQEVKFYAATNPGIMLEYGADVTAATTISSESVISRVHLYIGTKDKYGDKTKDNYIMMDIPWTLGERKQSFGSINWQ